MAALKETKEEEKMEKTNIKHFWSDKIYEQSEASWWRLIYRPSRLINLQSLSVFWFLATFCRPAELSKTVLTKKNVLSP